MPFVEDFREFVVRQGGGDTIKTASGIHLFANGAGWRQGDWGPIPIEAPENLADRLRNQRLYQLTKVNIFEKAFKDLKAALFSRGPAFTWNVHDLGPDPGDRADDPVVGRAALLYLRDQAANHRTALADIDRQIDDLPEARRIKEAEKLRQENRERMDAQRRASDERYREAIGAIELETETPETNL